ncbi:DUF805 domain-containing protein [Veillonella agrestimuris]|uniref:DUF805 domain-containing protein n=1 Tax=Veillonella agrestimuris TaxID=2941340 RepID=UPI00203EE7C2|nr:DUF805 domain-containing protein [Veillonella agrestimuris]
MNKKRIGNENNLDVYIRILSKLYPNSIYCVGFIDTFKENIVYKYFEWEGRVSVVEYFKTNIILFLIYLVVGIFLIFLFPVDTYPNIQIFYLILFSIITIIPIITLTIRRLHDLDIGIKGLVWVFFPILGPLYIFNKLIKNGNADVNYYGAPTGQIYFPQLEYLGKNWSTKIYRYIFLVLLIASLIFTHYAQSSWAKYESIITELESAISRQVLVYTNLLNQETSEREINYINSNQDIPRRMNEPKVERNESINKTNESSPNSSFSKENLKPLQESKRTETKLYRNNRFGFSIKYPGNLRHTNSSTDGSGREFFVDDESIVIRVYGLNNITGETVQSIYRESRERASEHGEFGFRTIRDNWYVVTYSAGDYIYYHKSFVGSKSINSLDIRIWASKKDDYTGIIDQLEANFSPGNLDETH